MPAAPDPSALAGRIRDWAAGLGFQQTGIAGIELGADEARLEAWLEREYHGEMAYLAAHGTRRSRPAELVSRTLSVISVRIDYLPEPMAAADAQLADPARAYVSRYALGRDYHKILRNRLQTFADRLVERIGAFGYRVYVDSGPVLEKALARNAGLGWIGKHTNLIASDAGSWFFLGELYTDLPLPVDARASAHCGTCEACIPACPTAAITAPWQLDARRCISYLTIEHDGAIDESLRPLMGNRIYGCDDCQLVCPWNKFAQAASHPDLRQARLGLDAANLTELFSWSETDFEERLRGSAIRRIGHERWLRNIAIALGNGAPSEEALAALESRRHHPSQVVREHVEWALQQLATRHR